VSVSGAPSGPGIGAVDAREPIVRGPELLRPTPVTTGRRRDARRIADRDLQVARRDMHRLDEEADRRPPARRTRRIVTPSTVCGSERTSASVSSDRRVSV
jgi:hypothetical protein